MLIFLISLFSSALFLFLNGFKMGKSSFTPWVLIKEVTFCSRVEKSKQEEEESGFNLLDLPELALETILDKLSPAGLCATAGVCSSLREKCGGDRFWEKHLRQKWGGIIGNAAFKEWQCNLASKRRNFGLCSRKKQRGLPLLGFLLSMISPEKNGGERRWSPPVDSVMAWYLALETGEFWFPAQVYNRENGHAGFMLSCYDAKLKYNRKTNTFQARYAAQGRSIEENITWDRVREAPVETPSHDLHISDCLHDLKPGDHVEIQWRRSKEFSYGWWYGVVGHLESCHGNENLCQCQFNDTVVLEFRQYPTGSQWRNVVINRKDHREAGNEVGGFYGGIRKLYNEEEISMWKSLWPKTTFQP